jgi:hypothetical protein
VSNLVDNLVDNLVVNLVDDIIATAFHSYLTDFFALDCR